MSDFNSSLPVRTEQAGDVQVKVVDSLVPSQQLKVNSDGSLNITDNAGSLTVDGTVELGATTLAALESITVQNPAGAGAVNIQDGGNSITVDSTDLDIRDLVFATDKVDVTGSTVALDATTLAALESITVQNGSGAAAVNIQDGGNSITVDAVDLDVRDLTHVSDSIKVGDGTDFLAVNTDGSINVVVQEDIGTEVVNYNFATAVAGGATSTHDLVFASASRLYQVLGTASGRAKIEVQIETGAATGVFNTVCVRLNSTATPDMDMSLSKYAPIPAGARVRVIRTNRDLSPMDLYSTIVAILG